MSLGSSPIGSAPLASMLYIAIGGSALTLSVSDSITFSDSNSGSYYANKSDSVSFSDSSFRSIGLVKSESVSFTDSKFFSLSLTKSDSVSFSDSKSFLITKSFSDSFSLADSSTQTIGAQSSVYTISFTIPDQIRTSSLNVVNTTSSFSVPINVSANFNVS